MRSKTGNKKVNMTVIIVLMAAVAVLLAAIFILSRGSASKDQTFTVSGQMAVKLDGGFEMMSDTEQMIAGGQFTIFDIDFNSPFENCVVIGDSVTEGLSAYGHLDEDKVFSKIGGSVLNSEDELLQAAATAPEAAFFSFGANEMGMFSGDEELFTSRYQEFIEKFMELSPSTKIYVNSISKPSESRIGSGGYFYKWQDFNQAIEEMCGRIGAEYIDNTYILIEHPDLYAGDGIHVSSDYYPYWLMHMASQARLW